MTEQLPRTIAFGDVQVGDTVRGRREFGDVIVTVEGPVARVNATADLITLGNEVTHLTSEDAITLLARPEPKRTDGSLWVEPPNRSRWIWNATDAFICWWCPDRTWDRGDAISPDDPIAKRLVPWSPDDEDGAS